MRGHLIGMNDFTGSVRIRPALNEAERAYLYAVADSGRTLRGTTTGRGDKDVPFAYLAWEVCRGGCCLTWDASERAAMMLPSLRFLVDHLFRAGAKGEGSQLLEGFTFDHVLDGVVSGDGRVVEVDANRVSERELTQSCAAPKPTPGRARKLPANVIQLRPRRA
ncbi:hypothetical protein J2X46_001282 [Nocardioides sp. BE266]|uniref:hypothetical protein n=1 Tax=Nocardioides sp. BE266 TaxID=2817725 RepID=UPI0028571C9C|nr:hypothetical protein [Nocardioides sp. BE266]MDR7252306.1 hypothetical protein [Nocardioides sp. BE266]